MMMKTTPFHPRLSELNQTGLYGHWSGYLSALRYDLSAKHEYFAVRNSAGYFDSSPLYKYRITGSDAERFLAGVMTRDVRRCRPGQAMYTVWCDEAGYVLEDGVLFRHADDDWLLTSADPNLGYLDSLVGRLRVSIEDVSAAYGVLAVQGPRSRAILRTLAQEVDDLPYFGLTPAKIGGAPVTISRTGYTGDLGFEVFVEADDALAVLDKVIQAGDGQGFRPFGEDALLMLRIEAGLALINVEFSSARYAFTDAERFTPKELGFGWMLGKDGSALGDDRPFIGRRAIERELREGTSRWATVGLWIDWEEFERLHLERGLLVPKDETPVRLGVDALRRRGARRARRLRHQPDVLPGAPAPHRDGSGAAGVRREGLDGAPGDHRRPRVPHGAGDHRPDAPVQPRAQDRLLGRARPDLVPNGAVMSRSTANTYDAIVVGGGHNGLTNAAYLAKAGLSVLVLERRSFVGGAAITEELHPGFSFTTFSYALSLLRPEIIQELELVKHGFLPMLMPTHFAPMDDGDYLLLTEDEQFNDQEIGRHSKRDVDGYHRWEHDLEKVIQLAMPLFNNAPPDIFSDDPVDQADVAWMMKQLRGADQKTLHDLVRFLTGSCADLLDDYFESDIVKSAIASSGHHRQQGRADVAGLGPGAAVPPDGRAGRPPRVVGLPQGRQRRLHPGAAARRGVVRRRPCGWRRRVDHVITQDGRATGVVLTDGTEFSAPVVVSALDPRRTFTELVDPRELPTDLVETIDRYRFQGTSAKVNFALDGLPVFPALKGRSTTTAASSTSDRRWSTSSGPSTTPSTAGTPSGPTSTAPSSRWSTRTWRLRAST